MSVSTAELQHYNGFISPKTQWGSWYDDIDQPLDDYNLQEAKEIAESLWNAYKRLCVRFPLWKDASITEPPLTKSFGHIYAWIEDRTIDDLLREEDRLRSYVEQSAEFPDEYIDWDLKQGYFELTSVDKEIVMWSYYHNPKRHRRGTDTDQRKRWRRQLEKIEAQDRADIISERRTNKQRQLEYERVVLRETEEPRRLEQWEEEYFLLLEG